jgi:GNAT superfamily N-acetyltransferase
VTENLPPVVRPATPGDAEEMTRLGGMMYEVAGFTLDDAWRARVLADLPRRLGEDLWGWVVDADASDGGSGPGGALAACALVDRHPRLCPPGEEGDWRGYLQWVCTDPRYRRRGYATAVVRALMDWCSAHGAKVLELHATTEGRPTYERLGWKVDTGTPMKIRLDGRASNA